MPKKARQPSLLAKIKKETRQALSAAKKALAKAKKDYNSLNRRKRSRKTPTLANRSL